MHHQHALFCLVHDLLPLQYCGTIVSAIPISLPQALCNFIDVTGLKVSNRGRVFLVHERMQQVPAD